MLVESDPFAERFYQRLGAHRIGETPAPCRARPTASCRGSNSTSRRECRIQGFAIHENVFDAAEIVTVIEALTGPGVTRSKAGARHVLSVPAVRSLAEDARLLTLAEQFVGPGATPFRATLFESLRPPTGWSSGTRTRPYRSFAHIDRIELGPLVDQGWCPVCPCSGMGAGTCVALRVHLDDSTSTNGPLRVLPNTHRDGVGDEAAIDQCAREQSAINCLAAAGGVVAMRPLTIHASSKSTERAPVAYCTSNTPMPCNWRRMSRFVPRKAEVGRRPTLALELRRQHDVSEGLGDLRRARERAGLEIEEISARTKIKPSFLRALETGHFEVLPGPFFTRTFLRTYAREVGVPPDEVVREYDRLHGQPPRTSRPT